MLQRLSPESAYRLCPRLPKHLIALGKVEPDSSIPQTTIHLVKLRVSQINHCCYCQHMHSQEARDAGERQARMDVLPAWREAPCFTSEERSALAWAEALTLISKKMVSDADFQNAVTAFGEQGLMELTSVVLEINSWNRIAASLQFTPDIN